MKPTAWIVIFVVLFSVNLRAANEFPFDCDKELAEIIRSGGSAHSPDLISTDPQSKWQKYIIENLPLSTTVSGDNPHSAQLAIDEYLNSLSTAYWQSKSSLPWKWEPPGGWSGFAAGETPLMSGVFMFISGFMISPNGNILLSQMGIPKTSIRPAQWVFLGIGVVSFIVTGVLSGVLAAKRRALWYKEIHSMHRAITIFAKNVKEQLDRKLYEPILMLDQRLNGYPIRFVSTLEWNGNIPALRLTIKEKPKDDYANVAE